jgi:hypothetical protein
MNIAAAERPGQTSTDATTRRYNPGSIGRWNAWRQDRASSRDQARDGMRRGLSFVTATAWQRAFLTALLVAWQAARLGGAEGGPAAVALPVRQVVMVLVPDWEATTGRVRRFARDAMGHWRAVGPSAEVVVGRGGSGWGRGIHPDAPEAALPGPQKREGDGRSPAGIFALGPAFGSRPTLETGLEYLPLERGHWCIDVADSPHYNQIVHEEDVGQTGIAGSSEPMRRDLHRGDDQYRVGCVIGHNPEHVANLGSCIFAHPWIDATTPTAGCVGMAEPTLVTMLAWLDAAASPRLVLLPVPEYQRLREAWGLPAWPEPLP